MCEIYGKSKEQALPMINIKALLFSVSFESQTDKQLVKCEDEKQRLVCLLEELEAQDNRDATVHVSDLLCNQERSACCVTHVDSTGCCTRTRMIAASLPVQNLADKYTHTHTQAPANHHTHGRDLRYCRRLRAQYDLQEACAHAKQLGVQVRRQRKESLTILKNHILAYAASAMELLLEGL
jgi:hypothetical protein